jgi:HlyD family secretion protein
MSASVEIYTETEKNVLSVPIQTVTTRERDENKRKQTADADRDGAQAVAANNEKNPISQENLKEVVFVVSADTVSMVEVKTGIQDDTYIHILSGLQEGQEVVTGPYTAISRKLEAGDRIQREADAKKKNSKGSDKKAN